MTDPKELMPCPFCGAEVTEDFGRQIICSHCGAGTMVHNNKSEAIAAWNRRALASLSASVGVTADFGAWWSEDGYYIDPDTSDVPWYDKRRGLAEAAYDAGAATGGKPWPDFVAPPKHDNAAPGWVDPALPDFRLIWAVAKEAGYAVGLHGSMKRDCDMIAVPWVDAHATPQELIDRLCGALNAREVGPREPKPNGRIAVNLQIDGWFRLIDLSIVPGASVGVTVKPLSWSYDARTSQWKAHSVLGEWRAWDINGWCITAPNEWPGRIVKGDGRVVANDEYAAIINSALSLPSSGGEVVAE